jgi:hypothetical protein
MGLGVGVKCAACVGVGAGVICRAGLMKKKSRQRDLLKPFLSGKRDSNPRPRPWQGRALPTELFPHEGMGLGVGVKCAPCVRMGVGIDIREGKFKRFFGKRKNMLFSLSSPAI